MTRRGGISGGEDFGAEFARALNVDTYDVQVAYVENQEEESQTGSGHSLREDSANAETDVLVWVFVQEGGCRMAEGEFFSSRGVCVCVGGGGGGGGGLRFGVF